MIPRQTLSKSGKKIILQCQSVLVKTSCRLRIQFASKSKTGPTRLACVEATEAIPSKIAVLLILFNHYYLFSLSFFYFFVFFILFYLSFTVQQKIT